MKPRVCITLSPDVLEEVDRKKGADNRSIFIEKIVRRWIYSEDPAYQ